jgi:putative ABC transport system permease protein
VSITTTLARRSLRARWGRSIFIGLSVLAGVAFVAGSFILADSIGKTFDNLIDGLVGDLDLEVRSELTIDSLDAVRDPVPASLADQISQVPGVETIDLGIARYAQMIDPDGKPVTTQGAPTLGVSWNPDTSLSGVELKEGRAPSGSGEVAIDKATADRVGFEVGDPITVILPAGQQQFTIVGLVGLGNSDGFVGATTVAFDFETARDVLGAGDTVDTIDIKVAPDADVDSVRAEIEQLLPERTEVVTGKEVSDELKDQVGVVVGYLRIGLLIFAAVTAFVAAFVINNVYSITIGQRLRELALLRAVGAGGPQVRRLVLIEAFVVASIATVLGIFGGLLVAKGMIGAFNAAGGGFPPTPLVIKLRTIVVAVIVGIGVTVLSVLIPAWRASRIPPVAAMRPELGFTAISAGRRLIVGVIVTAVGLGMFLIGLFANQWGGTGLAVLAGGGALLTFLGVTSVSTTVARPVSRVLGWPIAKLLGTGGKFARDNAARSPRRTAKTASALMIGVALITSAAVLTSSFRDTLGRALQQAVTADFIVLDTESFQLLPTGVATSIEQLPELSAVSPFRTIRANVAGADGESTASFFGINPEALPELMNLDVTDGGFDGVTETDGVMVFRDYAEDRDLGVGDTIDVTWQNGAESTITVAGLFDDNSLDTGWLVSTELIESVSTQTPNDQFVIAKVADGVSIEEARTALEGALSEYPQATIQTKSEFQQSQEDQINQLLALVTILLVVAIAFSFLGIAITLALSVFERTREIGLLRAVGMSRRKLRRSVRWEAVIVALFGVVVGVAVGLVFGITLAYASPSSVINGVTIPYGTIVLVMIFAVIAAVVAALYPAYKASRMNVLEAIATE